ncbi:hypothetical protein R8G61_13065 [Tenacibaculum maritimum]
MKYFIKLVLLFISTQSCKSPSDFDLATLTLQTEKISSIVPDIKHRKSIHAYGNKGIEYVITKDDRFLNFNGTRLTGRQNPDSKKYGLNGVSFYYHKKDSILHQYTIAIYSTQQAYDLLHTLQEKLGKPNFKYFKQKERLNGKKIPRYFLWEDTTNHLLYLLKYDMSETLKARLEVKQNTTDIRSLNIMGAFGYWEDYLYARKQKGNSKYTYQDYLKDELQKDPESAANFFTE